MSSTLQGVWDSVFEGGVNSPTHRLMNLSFFGLFGTLLLLLILTGGNLHVVALLALAVGLFLSINWCVCAYRFVSELRREQERKSASERKTD